MLVRRIPPQSAVHSAIQHADFGDAPGVRSARISVEGVLDPTGVHHFMVTREGLCEDTGAPRFEVAIPANPPSLTGPTQHVLHAKESLALYKFLIGTGPDHRGRFLRDIRDFDAYEIEAVDDYIEWVLPLRERSPQNPEAPVLDDELIALIRSDALARESVHRTVRILLAFFKRTSDWTTPGHRNQPWIARILGSASLLLRSGTSRALLRHVQAICAKHGFEPPADLLATWKDAAESR